MTSALEQAFEDFESAVAAEEEAARAAIEAEIVAEGARFAAQHDDLDATLVVWDATIAWHAAVRASHELRIAEQRFEHIARFGDAE